MKRFLNYPSIAILAVVLLVLGGAIATWDTKRFSESEYSTFSEQSIRLVSVLANSASVWLVRGNDEAIEFAASMMLAGSGQYVRIVLESGVVLDRRMDNPMIVEMDLGSDLESIEALNSRSSLRRDGLDVIVPIIVTSQPDKPIGVVQVGFSREYVRKEVRAHVVLVFGIAFGSWLLLLLMVLFTVRLFGAKPTIDHAQEADTERIIRCGALEIDTESCEVVLFGQHVELAPKMFELLTFLARQRGKTFSDRDLLTALWSDAPYAASGDVKQCIYMLRKRLGVACADPKRIIANVKGFGYKLECRDEDELSDP